MIRHHLPVVRFPGYLKKCFLSFFLGVVVQDAPQKENGRGRMVWFV